MFCIICFMWRCLLMCFCFFIFFFKQKTAYEMRISDWSSDVCSSDLLIMQAEAEEIRQTWQKTPPRSLSGNTGSTKGGTAKPEMSGKLPDIPPSLGPSYIEALSGGI